ncbi:hypothetical protein [Nocardia sp. NPDC002869]|uniref:hypothetical protein n=1 Tax=Nocardia sp. NPDC002869 TaxID=3161032 RepID=UPI00398C97E1
MDHKGGISMLYSVTVNRVGQDYRMYCPALGVQRYVTDKKLDTETLEAEARAMISRCGGAAKTFDVELELDRSRLRPVQ